MPVVVVADPDTCRPRLECEQPLQRQGSVWRHSAVELLIYQRKIQARSPLLLAGGQALGK